MCPQLGPEHQAPRSDCPSIALREWLRFIPVHLSGTCCPAPAGPNPPGKQPSLFFACPCLQGQTRSAPPAHTCRSPSSSPLPGPPNPPALTVPRPSGCSQGGLLPYKSDHSLLRSTAPVAPTLTPSESAPMDFASPCSPGVRLCHLPAPTRSPLLQTRLLRSHIEGHPLRSSLSAAQKTTQLPTWPRLSSERLLPSGSSGYTLLLNSVLSPLFSPPERKGAWGWKGVAQSRCLA